MHLTEQVTQPSIPEYRICKCGKQFKVRPHKWASQSWCSKRCAPAKRIPIEPSPEAIRDGYRLIPLTLGQIAIVDACDYEWLNQWSWFAVRQSNANTYYARRHLPKQPDGSRPLILMHRLIMGDPDGMFVDHRDHDGLNCRRSNLRVATAAQNNRNRRKSPIQNLTGVKGVTLSTDRRPEVAWRAKISVNGKLIHLGGFPTREEAAEAYRVAAVKYHGEFAYIPPVEDDTIGAKC